MVYRLDLLGHRLCSSAVHEQLLQESGALSPCVFLDGRPSAESNRVEIIGGLTNPRTVNAGSLIQDSAAKLDKSSDEVRLGPRSRLVTVDLSETF